MSAFDEQREAILKEYFELLRFPTIGAEPMRLKDCVDCAMWLKKWLVPQGFAVELMQAPKMLGTPPILLAERKGTEGAPTILFYGHYDVQPPDPLDAWETPPFEPTLKDDQRVYCRGAQDDKGQFFSFLCGMRNFLARAPQAVPTIKIVLEGQEESGSTALAALATGCGRTCCSCATRARPRRCVRPSWPVCAESRTSRCALRPRTTTSIAANTAASRRTRRRAWRS